jgi:4-hydroxythreonine-4-phosphate dehydrogenase
MSNASPIAVSMGDPAGIGPEIILKAWSHLNRSQNTLFAIGDVSTFTDTATRLDLPAPCAIMRPADAIEHSGSGLPVLQASQPAGTPITPGAPHPANAALVRSAIEDGVALCLTGQACALVTAPIAKSVMYEAGFAFPGHTEFLAELTKHTPQEGPRGPVMMLSGGGLRVVLTSIHEPIAAAISNLSEARVEHVARVSQHALIQDFGIAAPRLALAGLNPHAGEAGSLGSEEMQILDPLARRLRDEGVDITDTLPPDTMFHAEARANYDVAICHYHDQGLIPVKTLDFHGGVNITLGLPIVRTSPDHGTAFDIAGQGVAQPTSLIAAIVQAAQIAGFRT